jgi:arylsulfatase A-like enzyme
MRKLSTASIGLGLAAVALSGCKEKAPEKPNILYIMSDDHAFQAISAYGYGINHTPNIDRLAAEGMRFDKAFCTNSLSAPSRAVVLTGKFSHMNGLRDNTDHFNGYQTTLPKLLKKDGYQTAIVGKWHLKTDPQGFDFWRILIDQGPYYNPDLKDSTGTHRYEGYTTTVIGDQAIQWLDHRDPNKPFLLMVHNKAPHRNWLPEPKYFDLYRNKKVPVPDNYFDDYSNRGLAAHEQEMSVIKNMTIHYDLKVIPNPGDSLKGDDKWWEAGLTRMTPEQRAAWDNYYKGISDEYYSKNLTGKDLALWKFQRYMEDYLACIQSVDDQVGRLMDYLKEHGLDKNTLVVYTSDQGFYMGEHGWFDKRFMYEESERTPLIMRLPGVIPAGSTSDAMVMNLDYTPTFLNLAGAAIPDSIQGVSMLPVLESTNPKHIPANWRDAIYYHYYEFPAVHMVKRHYGVRTDRYKLIHFYNDIDQWELYDLQKDPHEMNNVFNDPAYADVIKEMRVKLIDLQKQYQDTAALAKD